MLIVPPNYAFERPGLPSVRARVRLSYSWPPSARLKRLRPAAQRERQIPEELRFEAADHWRTLGLGGHMTHQFDVIVERDADGVFVASVPALPGCHTQARSLDELMVRIREAIELCL